MVPSGPAKLIKKGSGDVVLLSNLGHLTVDALIDPNVFDNFDTGLRISIVASGTLHRATSGGWWMVTNHNDSGLHRHPTTTRGVTETVNWNLKHPGILTEVPPKETAKGQRFSRVRNLFSFICSH